MRLMVNKLSPTISERVYGFYARKQPLLSAHLSHRNSVCLSVCPSHGGSVKNDVSYDHQIFTVGCPDDCSFRNRKAFP